jgi:hypothetical protein
MFLSSVSNTPSMAVSSVVLGNAIGGGGKDW